MREREKKRYLDETHTRRIYHNILSNAVKYTPAGGKISVQCRQIIDPDGKHCRIETVVQDTGIGMDEEFIKRATEPFSREHGSSRNNIVGTGLGLAITKSLVDVLGGFLAIESKVGEGTRITISLPHEIAENPEAKTEGKARENLNLCGLRFLLAEDNDINAELASIILQDFQSQVERAVDGKDALEKLQSNPAGYYDLILMDIQMPNMDGYEASRAIRKMTDEKKRNIPIIAMTANAFEEDKRNALEAGMDGHVAKPFDVAALQETIFTILH